jgi:hypothetical protein
MIVSLSNISVDICSLDFLHSSLSGGEGLLLKTAKNRKDIPSYSHIRLNEDLTATRSKLAFICSNLVKGRDSKQTWTIDGKIFIKDRTDAIHRANSETEFNDMMHKLNITVPVVESKRLK